MRAIARMQCPCRGRVTKVGQFRWPRWVIFTWPSTVRWPNAPQRTTHGSLQASHLFNNLMETTPLLSRFAYHEEDRSVEYDALLAS